VSPGLAGLFAKVTVVRSLLDGGAGWLAVVVAVNAVIGLAYYLRLTAALWAAPAVPPGGGAARGVGSGAAPAVVPVRARTVGVVLAVATAAALVIGFAPQLVLDVAAR